MTTWPTFKSEIETAIKKRMENETELKEALRLLRDLADIQNGAPLEQHRKEWEETMEEVYAFLNKHEQTE